MTPGPFVHIYETDDGKLAKIPDLLVPGVKLILIVRRVMERVG